LIPECVNNGGNRSIVRLSQVPELEREVNLEDRAATALAAWQARPGAIITVVDPPQQHYRARLVTAATGGFAAVPFQPVARPAESRLAVEVYQALPHKERFELVLQKLTELGVARIVPFTSARSATLAGRDAGQKKSHRWPEVVRRAARQCRRAMLPELDRCRTWNEALALAQPAELKLLLYEGEAAMTLGPILAEFGVERVALMVGPEGGFAPEEVAAAKACGFRPVGLGPRILRTETAAIVATAILQYVLGDLS
jgi:16S rRNA (uracil1498-N3)-methyltransferase